MKTNTYKERILSNLELKSQLRYNKATGQFAWITDKHNQTQKLNPIAGTVMNHGYVRIVINGNGYLAHRLAWMYVTGKWPINRIDHKDTNRSNNSWKNLSEVTNRENCQNKKTHRLDGKLLGANWDRFRNTWYSEIFINGKTVHLGRFPKKELAHASYMKALHYISKGVTDYDRLCRVMRNYRIEVINGLS
jgi:hypothetical protein